jgi:hypothetical protein
MRLLIATKLRGSNHDSCIARPSDAISYRARARAIVRLQRRSAAVDNLISALERYQQCAPFTAAERS